MVEIRRHTVDRDGFRCSPSPADTPAFVVDFDGQNILIIQRPGKVFVPAFVPQFDEAMYFDALTQACTERKGAEPTFIHVYGDGGWNRYFVRMTGEIVYSRHHGRNPEVAVAQGFRLH